MKSVFLSGAAVLALSAPAFGQISVETETATGSEAGRTADVIVVEATYTEFDSFVYPGMTSSLDRDTLDLRRPSDLDDLLRDLPGVEVSGGPRRTGQTLSLRGQGREAAFLPKARHRRCPPPR